MAYGAKFIGVHSFWGTPSFDGRGISIDYGCLLHDRLLGGGKVDGFVRDETTLSGIAVGLVSFENSHL